MFTTPVKVTVRLSSNVTINNMDFGPLVIALDDNMNLYTHVEKCTTCSKEILSDIIDESDNIDILDSMDLNSITNSEHVFTIHMPFKKVLQQYEYLKEIKIFYLKDIQLNDDAVNIASANFSNDNFVLEEQFYFCSSNHFNEISGSNFIYDDKLSLYSLLKINGEIKYRVKNLNSYLYEQVLNK